MTKSQGFTLIEILVALVILSIGLGALMLACSENIRLYQALEDRMIASWLATETFNKLHMKLIEIPINHSLYGKSQILGREYQWQLKAQNMDTLPAYQVSFAYRRSSKQAYQQNMQGYQFHA